MAEATRDAYGKAITELGAKNDKVVALDADLAGATKSGIFKAAYPDRFFDFGIAEANMVAAAAGMARAGLIPFASTFALFGAGRAFEIIRNAVCYANANVKFGFSHAGLSVGEDGGSHQSIEDIALMRVLPNMTVFVPCDAIECRKAVFKAAEIEGPVFIRTSRMAVENVTKESTPFEPGKSAVLRKGKDVCLIACGLMVGTALKAADLLAKDGIEAAVVDMYSIKPIDRACILRMARNTKAIVTAEEHSVIGGLGSAVAEVLAGKADCGFAMVGVEDLFGQSGKPAELFKAYGLTAENIAKKAKKAMRK